MRDLIFLFFKVIQIQNRTEQKKIENTLFREYVTMSRVPVEVCTIECVLFEREKFSNLNLTNLHDAKNFRKTDKRIRQWMCSCCGRWRQLSHFKNSGKKSPGSIPSTHRETLIQIVGEENIADFPPFFVPQKVYAQVMRTVKHHDQLKAQHAPQTVCYTKCTLLNCRFYIDQTLIFVLCRAPLVMDRKIQDLVLG